MSTFCTSIHCLDGRIQEPIINFLKEHYGLDYVDTITEPGPCKILAENNNQALLDSIRQGVEISINKHRSRLIAISGHHDCAGNPCDSQTQKEQIKKSVSDYKKIYPEIEIIGLWIDSRWKVQKLNYAGLRCSDQAAEYSPV